MIKLPRLPVGWKDRPQLFERYWDEAMRQIEANINELLSLPVIEAAISSAAASAAAANTAAAAANTAAAAANTAALDAADTASLTASGVVGAVISGIDAGASASVDISAHTRVYGDGTSVSVSAGSLTGLSYSTTYFLYYDDPARSGGSVTYASTPSQTVAAQTGARHLVGQITTPAATFTTSGKYVGVAGVGSIY